MFWIIAIIAFLIIMCLAVYVYAIRLMAIQEIRQAPREDMAECHAGKHGPFLKKYAIVSHDYGTAEPVLICPFCYDDAVRMAKESAGLKSNSPHKI